MQYQKLQSVTVVASPDKISCCGGSSTLSTTAYFKLITKTEDGTTTADTATNAAVTASYSDDKSYTTIEGNKITFDKNAINYPTTSKADARDSIVTGSYTYSGITATDKDTITQSENNVGDWELQSNTTTALTISPTALTFGSCEQTIDYSVTRYYDSYYEKYDSCRVKMDSKTDNNNMIVTPSEASADGSFSATTTNVSIGTNTGAYRTGTLTVKYDGKSKTAALAQAASQQGRYYEAAYGHADSLDVTNNGVVLSCDGDSATFVAYYNSIYYKDYVDKDHCGNEIGSGTESYPSTVDVTTLSEWTTEVGSISNGVLTVGSTTSDRTIDVSAIYGRFETIAHAYQKDCKPALTNNCASVEVQGRDWTVTLPYAATSDLTYTFHAVNGFEESGNDLSGLDWTQTVDVAKGSKTGRARSSQYQFATDDSTFSSVSPSEDDTYNYSDCSITINSDYNGGDSGGGTEPEAPVLTSLSLTNNLPGEFKVQDPNSTNIETVSADGKSKTSFSTVLTNGGAIDIQVPKSSMLKADGGLCGSCQIAISIFPSNYEIKATDGNFKDQAGEIWWIPNEKNYNDEMLETITIYSGSKEVYVRINIGD